jgi:hypothetical protein
LFPSYAFLALLALAATARGQALVVKDRLCGLFDADGGIQFGAPGVSTIAPNDICHLACWAQVPAPGKSVRLDPTVLPTPCNIEGVLTWTWEERISPSGQAMLECWVRPR